MRYSNGVYSSVGRALACEARGRKFKSYWTPYTSLTVTTSLVCKLRVCNPLLMLFSLVYTWIKYKMSPPSIVALNRLFVERDSKHRRITSNLGLTFRNSKWSGYARTNINLDSKNDFLWTITRVLLFLISLMVLFIGLGYYNMLATLNPFTLLYWFAMDSNLYFQVTTISGLLYLLQLSIDTLQQKFMLMYFGSPTYSTQAINSNPTTVHIPKRLHKPLLYSLVQQSTSSDVLEKLLERSSRPQSGLTDLHFLKSLYRTTYLTKLLLHPTPIIRLVDSLTRSNSSLTTTSLPSFFTNVAKLRKPSLDAIALDYLLFRDKSPVKSLRACTTLRWNLAHLNSNNASGLESLSSINGLFYLSSITQTRLHSLINLHPELLPLNSSIGEQTQVIRWDKWLYKYSLLHRSSLKTGFYLNMFKSSLGSGFYNQDVGTRNLWLPSSLSSASTNLNLNYAGSLNTYLYGHPTSLNLPSSLSTPFHFYNKATLTPLSFYESSYNWALRRFYSLNSSNSNQLCYKPSLSGLNTNPLTVHNLYTASATNYSLNLLKDFTSNVNQSTLTTSVPSVISVQVSCSETTMDPYLAYSSQSFFSKERLELLHNITANRSSKVAIQNNQMFLDARLSPNFKSLSS